MSNQSVINKIFHAMSHITGIIDSSIKTIEIKLQTLSPVDKQQYLSSILEKTINFNEKMLGQLTPLKNKKKTRSKSLRKTRSKSLRKTLASKGGGRHGQLALRNPRQHNRRVTQYNYRQPPAVEGKKRGHTQRNARKFKQWAAMPLPVLGGGFAIALIVYKLILPLIFKKAPGSVARVSGKVGELVAIKIVEGYSWGSAAASKVIGGVTGIFSLGTQYIELPPPPPLTNSQGHPIPNYPLASGPYATWPKEVNDPPVPSSWLSFVNPDQVTIDPSMQFKRVIPEPYVEPVQELSTARYIESLRIPDQVGNLVESLLDSAIDDETRNIIFILCVIGGITLSIAILMLIDRHRASIQREALEAEKLEQELENPDQGHINQELLDKAHLEGQLAAYQRLIELPGNPLLHALQGVPAAMPAQMGLLGNNRRVPRVPVPAMAENLNYQSNSSNSSKSSMGVE